MLIAVNFTGGCVLLGARAHFYLTKLRGTDHYLMHDPNKFFKGALMKVINKRMRRPLKVKLPMQRKKCFQALQKLQTLPPPKNQSKG